MLLNLGGGRRVSYVVSLGWGGYGEGGKGERGKRERTDGGGVGSYAAVELLHPGESSGGICRCLAADEGILRSGSCEGEGGEGGSEGQGGKGELHFEDVGLWLELKVFLLRVVGLGDAEMSADELEY